MNHTQRIYRCVNCYQGMVEMDKNELLCKQCSLIYPIIDGIPILTRHAHQFVIAQAEGLSSVRREMEYLQGDLVKLSASETTRVVSERAIRMANGIVTNIALMNKQCSAIWEYAKNENNKSDTLAWATAYSGYSFRELLPYFYQDWYGTKPFSEVIQHIQPAINTFCDDRESLAVFGSAACGLLHALSRDFEKSVGVDLALPGLMMAKHLIESESLSMCLEKADWMNIDLSPPQKYGNDIQFITANATDSPFPDGSLSTVVTQYLLDIVPNTSWFIHEIRRILKPGGIWINFSKPFTWPLDATSLGPRQLSEVPPILHDQGFEELQRKMTRFNVLSVEDVFQGGERFDQEVHMFVARKSMDLPETSSSVEGRMKTQRDEVWNQIPKLVRSREVAIIEKKVFSVDSHEYVTGIQVMDAFIPMDQDFLSMINTLFEGVDGKRTVIQLRDYMLEQDITMSSQDFLDLIYCLNVEYYLLALN